MISKHPLGGNLWDAQYRLYPSTLSATLSVIVGVSFHAYNQAGQTCLVLHQTRLSNSCLSFILSPLNRCIESMHYQS